MVENSSAPKAPRGRTRNKLNDVVSRLRAAIISGEHPPGSRLQTYDELEPLLEVSRATLRHAISVLKREGFIESVERSRMMVSKTPPHLTRYGLIFREAGLENRFHQTLAHVAQEMSLKGQVEIPIFHGIHPGSEHPDRKRLIQQINSHRLAGLILRSQPEFLKGTGAMEDISLPKVGPRPQSEGGIHHIILDNQSLTDLAIEQFAARGRKKIAAIAYGRAPVEEQFWRSCAAYGVQCRPEWYVTVGLDYPQTARNIVRLIFGLPKADRPEGLLILDDNFMEEACAGLISMGVRVPEEVEVVSHCTWPRPVPSMLPIRYVGFDAQEVIDASIRIINQARSKEPVVDAIVQAKMRI